jgi:hypothetical protein
VRFAVETWSADYGTAMDDEAMADAVTPTDETVEVAIDDWAPRSPAPDVTEPECLLFVDGVRRIEANVWITDDDGAVHQGICASYGAGVVRCDGAAEVIAAEVRRGLFCPAQGAESIVTRHGTFDCHLATSDDPIELSLQLQRKMGALEAAVAHAAGTADVVVIDGPLKPGQEQKGYVGYVKTHRRRYGRPIVSDVVSVLEPGQRTPLFLLDNRRPRLSWYLRLPCTITHGWAGVVRLELSADHDVGEAAVLADRLSLALPRFASVAQKDPRAPQNLVPIGGLERELRRRLGEQLILVRALRDAAAADASAQTPSSSSAPAM